MADGFPTGTGTDATPEAMTPNGGPARPLPQGRGRRPEGDAAVVPPPLGPTVDWTGARGFAPELDAPAVERVRPAPGAASALPRPLPRRRGRLSPFWTAWFLVAFVAPVVAGTLYFGLIASKQYVCEFHFTIREPMTESSGHAASAGNNLSAFLGRSASGGGVDALDNYTVVDYVASPQAAADLDQRVHLQALYSRSGIDPLSRLNGAATPERLAAFWKRMVYSSYDPATGLAMVKVRAFAPEDAFAVANSLTDLAQGVVNTIGRQSRSDSARFAQQEVDRAQRQVDVIRGRLAGLRSAHGVIDPNNSAVADNITLSNSLRATLTQQETQLAYLSSQLHDPTAPQIAQLKSALAATQGQLAAVDSKVAHGGGSGSSLTSTVGQFEQLDLQRRSAEQSLLNNLANLQQAVTDSDAQRLYMTTYVKPALPESSTYPNRLADILMLALVSALVWLIGALVAKSVLDHRV